ncbi:MAG: hypothetical protein RIQ52_1657 [Pseudomonadota bacterium]|jgi:ABC-2 type transport system ATP-binding protein
MGVGRIAMNKSSMSSALAVHDLWFAYGARQVLKGVSFAVQRGQCSILLGPNGAGKSTLFALVARLYHPARGDIVVEGMPMARQAQRALARMGFVFQQTTLDLDLTVEQNLRYHAALHGLSPAQTRQRMDEELQRQSMLDRKRDRVRSLNGGHRRRVEIARALMHHPDVLLLDEPTAGLDIPSRTALVAHVHALCQERHIAVLWATHLLDEVYPQDQVIILHQGEVMATGTPAGIVASGQADDLAAAFFSLTSGSR